METSSSEAHLVSSVDPNGDSKMSSPMPLESQDQTITIQNHGSENTSGNYKMYKRRWIGMLAIVCLNLSTGLVWLTFNAVSGISEEWFNASLTEVNLSVTLYFIGCILVSSFSGYVFERWGLKKALIIGGVVNLVGTWIRYFGSFIEVTDDSNTARLVVVLFGQLIAAAAQPFFLNAPPKYSAVWFSDSSRTIGTTIGSISNPLGGAFAMVLIPELCGKKDDMPFTLLVVGIISVVALIPAILMPEAPPTPPSASAEIALAEAADGNFLLALKAVAKNVQFWILFLAFAIFVAFFNCSTSLMNQIVVPYGYTDDDAGIFGLCMIGAGLFGAAISGALIDKTKKYKLFLKTVAPFLAVSYTALVFVVQKNNYALICCVCVLLGFSSFGLLPVALELGVECTYPSPPSTCTSVLWMGGQAFAVVFLTVGDSIRDSSPFKDEPKDTLRTGLISMAAIACATTLLAFAFNSPYHRMEAEKAQKTAQTTNNSSLEQS